MHQSHSQGSAATWPLRLLSWWAQTEDAAIFTEDGRRGLVSSSNGLGFKSCLCLYHFLGKINLTIYGLPSSHREDEDEAPVLQGHDKDWNSYRCNAQGHAQHVADVQMLKCCPQRGFNSPKLHSIWQRQTWGRSMGRRGEPPPPQRCDLPGTQELSPPPQPPTQSKEEDNAVKRSPGMVSTSSPPPHHGVKRSHLSLWFSGRCVHSPPW